MKPQVDFNAVLRAVNLLLIAGILYCVTQIGDNPYVNRETMFLGVLLCAQTYVALLFERTRRDPFVILLAFSMTIYYSLRIITLSIYPFSVVFMRYAYDAGDSNYALIFILIANCALYGGFLSVRSGNRLQVTAEGWKPRRPGRVIAVLVAAIMYAYLSVGVFDEDALPRFVSVVSIFLNPGITVLMVLSYFFVYRPSLTRRFAFYIFLLLGIEMAIHTLLGSRSALVGFVQNCLYVALALAGSIRFPRKYLLAGIAGLPVLVLLLVASFTISTFNRANKEAGGAFDLGQAVALSQQGSALIAPGTGLDLILPPIFNRAGFFDYAAEIIAHREEYQSILNLSTYGKSIVDNVLTPGFDVYDQPKMSNALQFAYLGMGTPSKAQVTEFYQSDQLGIYGEFYALFQYWSVPLLFGLAAGLKLLFVRLSGANPFMLVAKRAVLLFIFMKLVDSFGVDWVILETLPLVVGVYLYSLLFASRRSDPSLTVSVCAE
ncbi:MAG: hypothetical protein JSR66_14835 [Proteobacteria bacterium]|nr:hypothetical protein [Pseudomonadota bacterium]